VINPVTGLREYKSKQLLAAEARAEAAERVQPAQGEAQRQASAPVAPLYTAM
jgi:hypothetical protein